MTKSNQFDIERFVNKLSLLGKQFDTFLNCQVVIVNTDEGHEIYDSRGRVGKIYKMINVKDSCIVGYRTRYKIIDGVPHDYGTYVIDIFYLLNNRLVHILPKHVFRNFSYSKCEDKDVILAYGRNSFIIKPQTGEYVKVNTTMVQHVGLGKLFDGENLTIALYQYNFMGPSVTVSYDLKRTDDQKLIDIQEVKRQIYK